MYDGKLSFLTLFDHPTRFWLQKDVIVIKYHDITVNNDDCNLPTPPPPSPLGCGRTKCIAAKKVYMLLVPFHNLSWFSIRLNGDPEKNWFCHACQRRCLACFLYFVHFCTFFFFATMGLSSFFMPAHLLNSTRNRTSCATIYYYQHNTQLLHICF